VTSIAVENLGAVCTGDINNPLIEADTLLVREGRVSAVGRGLEFDEREYDVVLDGQGNLLAPGLIDSHVHTVLGDYTPRQQTIGFLESYAHGGITRALSASEVHAPGRPTDPAGVKALALVAHRSFGKLRPGGMTVHGGSLILEPGTSPSLRPRVCGRQRPGWGTSTRLLRRRIWSVWPRGMASR
jgi:enamidase